MRSAALPLPTDADTALRRQLADAVVAQTRELVELAARGAWSELSAPLLRRRAGLVRLEQALLDAESGVLAEGHGTLAALRAAVLESERLLAWLVPRNGGPLH